MRHYAIIFCLLFSLVGCDYFKSSQSKPIPSEEGLFLIHAKAGNLTLDPKPQLVLTNVDKTVAYLVHKPERRAGKMKLNNFLDAFSEEFKVDSKEPFSAAYIFYADKTHGTYSETSIVLSEPDYDFFENTLSFNLTFPHAVQVISPGVIDEVTLFIDVALPESAQKKN